MRRVPPKAMLGDTEPDIPFELDFLDPEHRAFPARVPKAASGDRPTPPAGEEELCRCFDQGIRR